MGGPVRNLSVRYRPGPAQARSATWRAKRCRREQLRVEEHAPTSDAEQERRDRLAGYAARDLTALLMGDPPVGFSAGDRRGGGA